MQIAKWPLGKEETDDLFRSHALPLLPLSSSLMFQEKMAYPLRFLTLSILLDFVILKVIASIYSVNTI